MATKSSSTNSPGSHHRILALSGHSNFLSRSPGNASINGTDKDNGYSHVGPGVRVGVGMVLGALSPRCWLARIVCPRNMASLSAQLVQ